MMLWVGLALLLAGLPALLVDRRLARTCRATLEPPLLTVFQRTTDWAKGAPWIIGTGLLFLVMQAVLTFAGEDPQARYFSDIALALLASFVTGSIVLHAIKLLLGRRRPRDDFEHGLYGFVYFQWHLQHNSFPSGHALTIFCVATWASALLPILAPLWFLAAAYFAMTRVVLAVHFLSDVIIGAAIGVIATRETMRLAFPHLVPIWF